MEVIQKIVILISGGIVMSFLMAIMYTIATTSADDLWEITCGLTKHALDAAKSAVKSAWFFISPRK